MKTRIFFTGGVFLFALSTFSFAEESNLDTFFTRTEANTRLTQIRGALTSFRKLSNLVYLKSNLKKDYKMSTFDEYKIPLKAQIKVNMLGSELKKIGNQSWEIQNIGFANWPKYVEGYIEYLELKNMKLQLELAQKTNAGTDKINSLKDQIAKKEAYIRKNFVEGGYVD